MNSLSKELAEHLWGLKKKLRLLIQKRSPRSQKDNDNPFCSFLPDSSNNTKSNDISLVPVSLTAGGATLDVSRILKAATTPCIHG